MPDGVVNFTVYLCPKAPRMEDLGNVQVLVDADAIWCPWCGKKLTEHERAQ